MEMMILAQSLTVEGVLVAGVLALAGVVTKLFTDMQKRYAKCEKERSALFLLVAEMQGLTVPEVKAKAEKLAQENNGNEKDPG